MHRTETPDKITKEWLQSPAAWDSTLPQRLWAAGTEPTEHGLILVSRTGQETKHPWTVTNVCGRSTNIRGLMTGRRQRIERWTPRMANADTGVSQHH